MITHWRCVKMSSHKNYEYVALEFNQITGQVKEIRLESRETDVRKRSTTEFEIHEVNNKNIGTWMTISYKEVAGLMRDLNEVRRQNDLSLLGENDILKMLYNLENLR